MKEMKRTALNTAWFFAGMVAAMGSATAQKPKSNKEVEAINAAISAQDPKAKIAAAEAALQKFADTEFKSMLQTMMVSAALDSNDPANVIIYGENALKTDPKNYQVQFWMSLATVQATGQFDLDREEKLKRAEKLATDGLANLVTAAKPNPQLTDDQWAGAKKQIEAQGHEALGQVANARKKYDVAIKEYETAQTLDPNATTMTRLAGAYNSGGRPADAIKMVDQILAQPNLHPAVKQVATAEKDKATKALAGAK
jgi:tetratricopeptide (TPR) repeat protein